MGGAVGPLPNCAGLGQPGRDGLEGDAAPRRYAAFVGGEGRRARGVGPTALDQTFQSHVSVFLVCVCVVE
jgi:hypothetical protein